MNGLTDGEGRPRSWWHGGRSGGRRSFSGAAEGDSSAGKREAASPLSLFRVWGSGRLGCQRTLSEPYPVVFSATYAQFFISGLPTMDVQLVSSTVLSAYPRFHSALYRNAYLRLALNQQLRPETNWYATASLNFPCKRN
jgi:hypothetical protein